jgi:PAS domain S-box-containing protein
MFRVKDSETTPRSFWAGRIVGTAWMLALVVSIGAAGLIIHEYSLLANWPAGDRLPAQESLRKEVQLQFAVTLTVTVLLAFLLAVIWWFSRHYFASQESLRQVKMLAHDILASMDQGVVTTDLRGVVTSINSAAIHLLGVNVDCVGRALEDISSADLPLLELNRKIAEKRVSVQDQCYAVTRDGRTCHLQADGHVLKDNQETALGCIIHVRDVTERKLIEERMRRMERFISLGTVASGLHHEIKNPLTALSIHIQLLEERLNDPDAAGPVDELVGILKSEVVRLNGVLESFRNFASLPCLAIQPTDIAALLQDTIRLIEPQASQQQVRITVQHPRASLPLVPLDAAKFEQALLNLIINALEAMPAGGHLALAASVQSGAVHVEVADTGPGIPREVQENLFEPYFSTKDRGSGMGLALSEKLIGQHGGRIDYHTGTQGTTFRITVPLEHRNGIS